MQPLRLHLLQYLALKLAVSTAAGQTPTLTGLKERWGSAAKSLRIPGAAIVVVRGYEVLLLESATQ